MVLGGPRSATTWLANLLTTDETICLHDPLLEHTSVQLELLKFPGKRLVGISDTAALLFGDWLAKKIVLWRDPIHINKAIAALGLREIDALGHTARVYALGNRVPLYQWDTVFKAPIAQAICRYFDVPFCRYRFEELKKMHIQPHFSALSVGREAAQELVRRLAKEIA